MFYSLLELYFTKNILSYVLNSSYKRIIKSLHHITYLIISITNLGLHLLLSVVCYVPLDNE